VLRLSGAALRLRPGVPAVVAVRGLLTCAFSAVDVYVPLAITSVRGRSVVYASVAVTLTTVVWALGSWSADRLFAGRVGPFLVRTGLLLMAAGTSVELLLLASGVPLAVGLLGAGVAGLGIGLAHSPLSALVLSAAAPGEQGSASSALSLFDNLGFAAGSALTGVFVGLDTSEEWTDGRGLLVGWSASVAIALAALAATVRLRGLSHRGVGDTSAPVDGEATSVAGRSW
jgi:hypothetical protein